MAHPRRLNPAIEPSDISWEKAHAKFDYLVRQSDKTLGDILVENFTKHEIRQFFVHDRPDIKAMQKRNTLRYNSLLTDRFSGATSDIPTKLSMMYFGLPVEPVKGFLQLSHGKKPEDLESQVAQARPLVFLENDELSKAVFNTAGMLLLY